MSDPVVPLPKNGHRTRQHRGQSFVEFALVLPRLIVLFLGIADFGRVFHAGIVIESASRNAAESAAQEYLQIRRDSTPATSTDFDDRKSTRLNSSHLVISYAVL